MSNSTPMRPQPPSIDDPRPSEADQWEPGVEDQSTSVDSDDDGEEETGQPNWQRRAQDAKRFSTSYVETNYRRQWEDSIRAFNNQHSGSSKYNSEVFRKRSNIYRPKTRTIIRKNEAAAAAAFFSNLDLIDVQPTNGQDKADLVAAAVLKSLLQYRLRKTIPWFHVVLGGLQDAQVQGAAAAHVYWKYTTKKDRNGKLQQGEDKPCVDLVPIENILIDPSAHWCDPINTSPYVIHCIPMYYGDVKERMTNPDPKGRKWKWYDEATFRNITAPDDSTRQARMGNQEDPVNRRREVSDYDIVWVDRHIHRWRGNDYEFYTINSEFMLTQPERLDLTVFHGRRPYVMGVSILETHKPMPSSVPKLVEGLQAETNEIANQRLDNVKFVLNKRWFAKRGKNVDLPSLVRNVPGGITMMDDPEGDVKEVNWPDVTASAYKEQELLNVDFDELIGNFSPNSVRQNRTPRESEGAMLQLAAPSNLLTEYMLKTYVDTFILPIVRQLVLLEQHYETDQTILALAGRDAEIMAKYGVNQVTDEIIDREMMVDINVGMGATDPVSRIQRFIFAIRNYQMLALKPPPGVNLAEIWKEIMALSGYKNGERFTTQSDPDKAKAEQAMQMLSQENKSLKQKLQDKHESNVVKLQTTRETNAARVTVQEMKEGHSNRRLLAEHLMELNMADQNMQPQPQPNQTPQV
jgi:hypothetical protein